MMPLKNKPVYIIGNGEHARVISALLSVTTKSEDHFFISKTSLESASDKNIITEHEFLNNINPKNCNLFMGIGHSHDNKSRQNVFKSYKEKNFSFTIATHNKAYVDSSVKLGEGCQILANATVINDTSIGENALINTSASIDHDCEIGKNVHIAPGAIICGGVTIENDVFVGPGSTIVRGIKIGKGSIIGAGSVITKDITEYSKIIKS